MTEKETEKAAESAPETERLSVEVDVADMTVEDWLDLTDPVSPRAQFAALDRYVTVEGYASVMKLPVSALNQLVEEVKAIVSEIGNPGGN